MKKYLSILVILISNSIYFNSLGKNPNKPTESKSVYKILSRGGEKNHFALNKTFLKEIYNLKPNKSTIELEVPYYLKNEKFNIVKNESLDETNLSYKIKNLNNKNIGELNISEDNCKISFNYGAKKINLESDLKGNESYNKKLFKLIEKQKPTKYFKLNKDVLKELYDSEYEDFILEMPIAENKYETFYLKKSKFNFNFLSPRKDENYNNKKYKGISYIVNYFGENVGNLNLYESELDFNIDFLGKNISIENLETGKLKCVSVNINSSLDKDVKNIGQLVNKFDKVIKEREKINNDKKIFQKNHIKNFEEEDSGLDIKIEDKQNEIEPLKNKIIENKNEVKPIKIENKAQPFENDEEEIVEKESIVVNIASTDLDNLGIKIKEKISESNSANAPPPAPPTRVNYSPPRFCQRVLINVEVSYDHWIKMQPQNQLDLLQLTQLKGRIPSGNPIRRGRDGRFFSEDMIGKINYDYRATQALYYKTLENNPWDTSATFTQQQANLFGFTGWQPNQPETQKLIKKIFERNQKYVSSKIQNYLNKAIEVFDVEGIAVGINDIYINYVDNLEARTQIGDEYVNGPGLTPCGILNTKTQICRTKTDDRPQKKWFNQYTGMYQKQRYPSGSIFEGIEYIVGDALKLALSTVFIGSEDFGSILDRIGIVGFLTRLGYPLFLVFDVLWYAYEALLDPESYDECVRFIVPTMDGGYFMSTKLDRIFGFGENIRIGQSWKNIVTPGMEYAVIDRLTGSFGGKICYPRVLRDTIFVNTVGVKDTVVITTPDWQEGLKFYVGERIPYYDNEAPNNDFYTEPYKHEQYLRAFTSTEQHGDYLDQNYSELNDRQESHPFLNDEMPTFNHENYLPMYSNMKNTFGDAIVGGKLKSGMHLKDIGTVIPYISTPWASYNENNGLDLSIRNADKTCSLVEGTFNLPVGILPLLFDTSYYTIDYIRNNPTNINEPYLPSAGFGDYNNINWNLVDHVELYGEWYEYGNTDYPPYNIQKWNTWMFIYGIAQSLGARYFTTESNPNTILAPLARNLNYDESNYSFETGTPRLHANYAFSQYKTGAYNQSTSAPNTWFEWYMEGLAEDGFFIFADFTNPGDYDMDGEPLNSTYDKVILGLQIAYSLWDSEATYTDYVDQNSSGSSLGQPSGPTNPRNPTIEILKIRRSRAFRKEQKRCTLVSPIVKQKALLYAFLNFNIKLYPIGLAARHAYRLWERGYKYKFNLDNVCDEDGLTNQYPIVYGEKGYTFCGNEQKNDWCGTSKPFGNRDYDARYNYYDLGVRDGFIKKYRGYNQDGKVLSSVDMLSFNNGFDKLTGDLIRLNMTNYAVSGQNPYQDGPNGEQIHLTQHFRLEDSRNSYKHPFYGRQVPYAKIFIPTLEYVEGDTIRAFTDRLNIRQAFRPDFVRLRDSKTYALGGQPPNQIPNRITYADTNMTFRWSFVDTNTVNVRNIANQPVIPVEFYPRLVSTDSTLKIVAPRFRHIYNTQVNTQVTDSLYGIFPLTLYTTNTGGCESNPATKYIKIHPKKLLPVNERFNRWFGSTGQKQALKGWDFKNVWSTGEGVKDNSYYPSVPGQLGFYLRGGFVNDARMGAGTGWNTSVNYTNSGVSGINQIPNWTALTYTPVEMEYGLPHYHWNYFEYNKQNVRGNDPITSGVGNGNLDEYNRYLASPFKNWYSKKGAFSPLTRPVFTKGLKHFYGNGISSPNRNWDGKLYQVHGSYNYWRSGTVDTARSPIYTNNDANNNILNIRFDISCYIPFDEPEAKIPVVIDRCVGSVDCQLPGLAKSVSVNDYANGIGYKYVSPQGTTFQVPINSMYSCNAFTGEALIQPPIASPKCKVIGEDIFDTLLIYGRFGLSSPPVLLQKIAPRNLNTTSISNAITIGNQNTSYYNYDINDMGAATSSFQSPIMYSFRSINEASPGYKYLKVKHIPKPTFDKREWKTIMINLQQYDTCKTMQFSFVYKNGNGKRFNEKGDYRHFSVHSPLYITNMKVNGSFYLPLGTSVVGVDSAIQGCDKKAVYTVKIPAGHNARKYEIFLRKSSSPPIITKIKEGTINNVFNIADTTYTPNDSLTIIDSVGNLDRNVLYNIYAKLINNDSYVALDTSISNSANFIVDCPRRPMKNQGVLNSDSGFTFKNTDNNYKIIANFPDGHNVRTFQLFERKLPSTVWVKISDTIQIPSNSNFTFNFPTFNNKPDGEYNYRLELKNPSDDISPKFAYSNWVKIEQCLGCKALKKAIINPYPEGTSQPDPLTGNFSIKVSLERYHNVKKIELYERKINNAAEELLYNPNNTAQIGNKIWTYNTLNNLEFSYVYTFITHPPGIYYYAAKVYDINNKYLLTYGLKVIYPEREMGYCGPYLPYVYQVLNYAASSSVPTLSNRIEFYLNPNCPGNKYKIYAYKLNNYQNLLSTEPNLQEYEVSTLPREQTPIELFGTGQYISITQQELQSSAGTPTGQQSNGYFNRQISPNITSLGRWYAFDFICVGCLDGENKRTIYKYLAKPTTGQN